MAKRQFSELTKLRRQLEMYKFMHYQLGKNKLKQIRAKEIEIEEYKESQRKY